MLKNSAKYQKVRDAIQDAKTVLEFEEKYCSTHAQRNKARGMLKAILETLENEALYLRIVPDDEAEKDPHRIPF